MKKSQKSFFTDALEENRGRKPTTFTPPSFHDFQNAADICQRRWGPDVQAKPPERADGA
jgi:hypothetical protein